MSNTEAFVEASLCAMAPWLLVLLYFGIGWLFSVLLP